MNIFCSPGHKVQFTYPDNGYPYDRKQAKEKLTLGQTYTVKDTEVHNSHTDVWLEEIDGVFNSVMFEDAES